MQKTHNVKISWFIFLWRQNTWREWRTSLGPSAKPHAARAVLDFQSCWIFYTWCMWNYTLLCVLYISINSNVGSVRWPLVTRELNHRLFANSHFKRNERLLLVLSESSHQSAPHLLLSFITDNELHALSRPMDWKLMKTFMRVWKRARGWNVFHCVRHLRLVPHTDQGKSFLFYLFKISV